MLKDNEIVVIFRKIKKTNEIMGFLPNTNVGRYNIGFYCKTGHGTADLEYYQSCTSKATEEEYKNLYEEMKWIYEDPNDEPLKLVIRQKINYDMLRKEAWKE